MVLEGSGWQELSSVVLLIADPVSNTANQPGNRISVIAASLL